MRNADDGIIDAFAKDHSRLSATVIEKLYKNGFMIHDIKFGDFSVTNSKKSGKKVVATVTTTFKVTI